MIRRATTEDLDSIATIYTSIHDEEEAGRVVIGWNRAIYPTRATACNSLLANDLFVMEIDGKIVASAIINQKQVPCYESANWHYKASASEVMVLHTLTVNPSLSKCGYGREFIAFYESYALSHGCHYLRIDTNEKNERARRMYAKLGYEEVDVVPTTFNGISGVNLVCLEKRIE